MRTLTPTFPLEPPIAAPLHALLQQLFPAHVVSRLYCTTQRDWVRPPAPAKEKWEIELGHPLTDDQWLYCSQQTGKISARSRLRLTHYKYLHRLYYTPVRLHSLHLRDTDRCDRCRTEKAGFKHLAWDCAPI